MKRMILWMAVSAAIAFGQSTGSTGSSTTGGSYPELQTYLSLSDSQLQQLVQMQTTYYQSLQSVSSQIGAKQASLNALIAGGSQDASAVGALYLAIMGLQSQNTAAAKQFQAQAATVLSTDQQTKLAALSAAQQLQPTIGEAAVLGLLQGAFIGTSPSGPVVPLSITVNGVQVQPYPYNGTMPQGGNSGLPTAPGGIGFANPAVPMSPISVPGSPGGHN